MGSGSGGTASDFGNFLVETTGSDDVAKIGGEVARSQQRTAQQFYNEYKDRMGVATVEGLSNLDKDMARQEKNLSRQEQLISQIDPTIMEASQQALKLLRGEDAATLNPLRRQRDAQRQKLLNSLREQLGPGAETSTMGIQALTKFDMETDTLFSNAQQSAIGTATQVGNSWANSRPDMFREIMGMSNLGQQKYGLRANEAQGLFNAAQPLVGMSGAHLAGDMLRAQSKQAQLNAQRESGMAIGESWATFGMSGMGGGGGGGTKINDKGSSGMQSSNDFQMPKGKYNQYE